MQTLTSDTLKLVDRAQEQIEDAIDAIKDLREKEKSVLDGMASKERQHSLSIITAKLDNLGRELQGLYS